ncbi:MAG: hypothetical protein JW801_11870 [Bacteroidales bacterium]|nr:hypothetical protein [Bacteroidales bacterium]
MKQLVVIPLVLANFLIFLCLQGYSQSTYNDHFSFSRLRMDVQVRGNADTAEITGVNFHREGPWAGSRVNLIDTFRYGEMMVELFDSLTGEMIYSRGCATLFQEWQTTDEAKSGVWQFDETFLMPFPKNPVRIDISMRKGPGFEVLASLDFNPQTTLSDSREPRQDYEMFMIHHSGKPQDKLDILLLAEGYTATDKEKFLETADFLVSQFLEHEPYASYRNMLNVNAVFIPSEDAGADDPRGKKFVNTPLGCSFNTFGSDRYMTSEAPRDIFDQVSKLSYDQLIIMVNEEKYGGGAIYNMYTFISAENENAVFLMLHEFGHAFASLGDEYFNSSVAYTDYFDLTIEPYQPNITTLIDFDGKWADMIDPSTPVPTPDTEEYESVTGVFEGAGYTAKGMYRPFRTCIMKDRTTDYFCPVCRQAIVDMLRFYGK